jgi:hypothetical protein
MDQRSRDTEMFADAGTERCLALVVATVVLKRKQNTKRYGSGCITDLYIGGLAQILIELVH